MIPSDSFIIFIIFIIFCAAAAIQLFYWLWFYLSPLIYKNKEDGQKCEPVTVIICARNEGSNLKNFLPSVLEQKYPSYEVIVVNDCSEDNSDDVLGELLLKYNHLKVSPIIKDPKFTHSKKFAQFIGIKAASNEKLIFTDADCKPDTNQWLSLMASNFYEKTDIVLGYGGYMEEKGLLNKYIRYDTMFIAMQYFGMAIKRIPYMGVGRNLAYRRSAFFRNKGFGDHNHIVSGDDDLFVNSVSSATNTKVEFRTGSHTRSVPAQTFPEFLKQKKRHFSTAWFYRPLHKILLFLEPLSRMIYYASFAYLISVLFLWPITTGVFGLRLVIQTIIFIRIQTKLNERGLRFYSLIFDIFSPVLNGLIYFSQISNRARRSTWK
jgi:poly-beta-1,6-N-acetyl-D-glucosamine synthase